MDAFGQDQDLTAFDALGQDTLQIMLLLGKLGEAVSAGAPAAAVNGLFSELLNHIVSHFSMEERLMAEKQYQGRHWHSVVHRELLNEMRLAAARGSDREAAVDRILLRRIRAVFSLENDDEDVFRARAKLGLFKEVLPDVHPADLAVALPDFDSQQRNEIFGDLGTDQASGTLEEVDARLQRELVASLSIERVAELIDFMTPAQAAGVLRNLTPAESWAILQQLGPVRSRKIAALIEKQQKETLPHLATLRYLRAPPEMAWATLLADYRKMAAQATVWRYIYVVSAGGVLLGIADIKDVLMAEPGATLEEVMMTNVISLNESDSVEEAVRLFEHYGFDALPLVDQLGVLKGVLAARDVLTATDW